MHLSIPLPTSLYHSSLITGKLKITEHIDLNNFSIRISALHKMKDIQHI